MTIIGLIAFFVVVAILFRIARTIARLILGLFTAFVILSVLFSWTTTDYVEKFHMDRFISIENHSNFYNTLSQWDQWREEKGLILF